MRTVFCFLLFVFYAGQAAGQTIVCDTSAFVFNYFMRVTALSGVNLRKAPSQQAAKLVAIPYGAEIPVAAEYGDEQLPWETIENKYDTWRRTCYAGKTGYVFGGFLEEVYENTAVRIVVPDAGVDSQRDQLRLDPALNWVALAPSEQRQKHWPDFVQLRAKKIKLAPQPEKEKDESRLRPLDAPENTLVFFGGLPPNPRIENYHQPVGHEILFPGEVVPFDLYDEAHKQHHRYHVYSAGDPVAAPREDIGWPFTGIRNYQLRIREITNTAGKDDYKVVNDQLLFSGNLIYDRETGRINGPYPFLMGDFDNDRRLDIVLHRTDEGTVLYLFLSSKALPGFLMRVVAMMRDSCC